MSRLILSHYAKALIGKTVSNVRSLNKEELSCMCWYEGSDPTCVIEFTDNSFAIVCADPEMNNMGFLEIAQY